MEVVKLRIKTENGETECSKLSLVKDVGIEGDLKAAGGERQLCLADENALSRYRAENKGLCVERFMPNVTTLGLDYSTLTAGTVLELGTAVVEISSYTKKCFPECPIVRIGTTCDIQKNSAFAKVIKSGVVSV